MGQRNPLNRYRREAEAQTSESANVPASQQASESAGKQADNKKPTKSYRLHRSLTREFARWAFDHEMTESEAAERAFRLLMSQED